MAFTHALYYPWIVFQDKAWLKTAILYWEKISTIVPGYDQAQYMDPDLAYLQSENILAPIVVNPYSNDVIKASENFEQYISTNEATGIILPPGAKYYRIPTIEHRDGLSKLHRMKLTRELRRKLLESGRVIEDGEWLKFDRDSINYYMTLLATGVATSKHLALLTDLQPYEDLSNRVKRGDNPVLPRTKIGEGLLSKIVFASIGIAPETPLDDILHFREAHRDELGHFRTQIGNLAQEIDPETPTSEALEQQVHDIYHNKIVPAVNMLRDSLARERIRNIATLLESILFLESIRFIPEGTPENLIASIVVHAGFQGINYALSRKDQLSKNPYSYVLQVRDQLS